MIEITKVTLYPFEQEGTREKPSNLLAYADIILNHVLLIKGFKIFRSRSGGLFIGFPAQKGKNGQYFEQIVPLTKELKTIFRDKIIEAYKNDSLT